MLARLRQLFRLLSKRQVPPPVVTDQPCPYGKKGRHRPRTWRGPLTYKANYYQQPQCVACNRWYDNTTKRRTGGEASA